jgi:hypothetical protein
MPRMGLSEGTGEPHTTVENKRQNAMQTPRVIRFGMRDDLITEFTRRICHALALRLDVRHEAWGLTGVYEVGKDGPSHIVCSRRRPAAGTEGEDSRSTGGEEPLEYIDVRGVFTDPDWFFRLHDRPVGRVEQISRTRIEHLQETGRLTPLTSMDRFAAKRVSAQVERALREVDGERPYRGCTADVITPSLIKPSTEDGRIRIKGGESVDDTSATGL